MSKAQVKRKGKQAAARSPWPFVVMAVGAILIVAAGFLVWRGNSKQTVAAPQVTGSARLQVDRDSIDFGKVPLDQPVKAVFKLSNVGDQTLRISGEPRVELVEGCWPPRAVVGTTTLEAGQETTLSMGFTMHQGMDGPHEFRVHVVTNDPAQPEKVLTVLSDWGK